jgi:hypothetical protein
MQIVWTFPQFIVSPMQDGLTDVVTGTNWVCTASDKGITVSSSGSIIFASPNPAEFTPYDQITYAMVYGWVSGRLDMASIEQGLENQIALLSSPSSQSQKPPFGAPNV